jgi:SAM-dependent methyltransferase
VSGIVNIPTRLSISELNQIVACPNCKQSMVLDDEKDSFCDFCKEQYIRLRHSWHLIPSRFRATSNLWETWEELQNNGLASYTHDPSHNLGVGDRSDYLEFGNFCDFSGLVLDVGCGPQPWPTHFNAARRPTRFVGVDPLIEEGSTKYAQLCALGEFLPFRNNVFDKVVFATSLDHCIDPLPVLREAERVCQHGGDINIWIGEKLVASPQLEPSPNWYRELKKPERAGDLFHIKRLTGLDIRSILEMIKLSIVEEKSIQVSDYRRNLFLRLKRC